MAPKPFRKQLTAKQSTVHKQKEIFFFLLKQKQIFAILTKNLTHSVLKRWQNLKGHEAF